MTAINEESAVKNDIVPQQLVEASQLLDSIDRRLEDCALEWQSKISHRQWKLFNTKSLEENLSLLSRTYFAEKNLDEAFRHLLSCNKIFSESLKNFVCLLQGNVSVSISKICDAQNQCSTLANNWKPSNDGDVNRCSSKFLENVLDIRNCFADLVRAKVSFDTKFLGFEAVLHKTTSARIETGCLNCNVKRKERKSGIRQANRTVRRKRLTRSAKLFAKRDKEQSSITIGDAGNRISLEAGTDL